MADDGFTKLKFAWLDEVIADPTVCPNAFRLAYLLAARFLNRKTRVAYPGQEKLAALLGLGTPKAVKYLTDQLVAGGHLTVEASHGRGQTNKYTLVLKGGAEPIADSPADSDDNTVPTVVAAAEQTEKVRNLRTSHFEPAETSHNKIAPPAEGISDQGGTNATLNGDDVKPDFENWWQQYPKKVSKGAARKAYLRIVSSGVASPAELLAGAMRYAATRTDQDPRYTKDPGGWLNAERWTDEVQAAPQSVPFDRNGSPSWTEIALAGLPDE